MDQYLDYLLQKYQLTQDPVDAAAFADAFLNNVAPVPINRYLLQGEIWIVDEFSGSDNGSDIEVYLLQKDALQRGAQKALEILNSDIRHYRSIISNEIDESSAEELNQYQDKLNELQTCQNNIMAALNSYRSNPNDETLSNLDEAITTFNMDCNDFNLSVYRLNLQLP